MKDLKYSEILRLNKESMFDASVKPLNIIVLSNISVQQSKEFLELSLRSASIPAKVDFGDYNNIIQDSLKYQNSSTVIIFWEVCNIIDGLEYTNNLLDDKEVNDLIERTKQEIDLVINNLKDTALVLFNRFSSLLFTFPNIQSNNLKKIANQLNLYLDEKTTPTIKIIDIDNVIAFTGAKESLNLRFYTSSKTLYTIDFFKSYSFYIRPYILSANGKSKKALIFDCDNTLWNGILGEDGFDGVDMSAKSKKGKIFNEVQGIALALNRKGILIGLCSKNNSEDVDEVFNSHPDAVIKDENIAIKKVNWNDKVSNLKEIASELNIGLDSLVFIDDSSFEVNLIREQLPEVTVIQVPEKLYEYPFLMLEHLDLFFNLSYTKEDMFKTELYKQQASREIEKKSFTNITDYLISLELSLTIFQNELSHINRLAQLSQKTNQFNLTTKRYTETEISNFVQDENFEVFSISVRDKFGDNGVTGLCIIKIDESGCYAQIDTFLLSCRIIGRNLEYAIMNHIINFLNRKSVETVLAYYIATKKNDQVNYFYDKCSFKEEKSIGTTKNYSLKIRDYKHQKLDYIKINYGKIN